MMISPVSVMGDVSTSPRVRDRSGEMSVPGQPAINHIIRERLPPVGQATARMVSVLGQNMSTVNIIIEYKQDLTLRQLR